MDFKMACIFFYFIKDTLNLISKFLNIVSKGALIEVYKTYFASTKIKSPSTLISGWKNDNRLC